MSNEFEEVKINVRSLLTSSPKQLSIEQLLKDYRKQEGEILPFKRLGFNSIFELLQNLKDILILPENPNNFSLLSLIVDDKTSHLRKLVVKQKSNTKKRKNTSNLNEGFRNHMYYDNNKTYFNNKSNVTECIGKNNYQNNIFQNTENNYYRLRTHSSSISSSNSNLSSSNTSQNEVQGPGYVTDDLQLYLEKYISENQMLITNDKLKELIENHPNFLTMKTKCSQDVINLVESFLDISDKGVSLKNNNNYNIDIKNENNKNTMSYSTQCSSNNDFTDKRMISDFKNVLKVKQDDPMGIRYIDICKNQNMMGKLEDLNSFYNQNTNVGVTKPNLKNNTKYVKRQSEIRMKNNMEKRFSLNCSSEVENKKSNNSTSSLNDPNMFYNSALKTINNGNIENTKILNRIQCVPKEVLFNIAKIFMVYREGVNVENYLFIYYKLYYCIFDPIAYGFTSVLQLFKSLYEMVEIRNNVLYTRSEFMYSELSDTTNYKNDILEIQKNIIDHVFSNKKLEISLNVEQPLLPFANNGSELIMLLAEVYNPSLFYLQLAHKIGEFNHLMTRMQNFYIEENTNYFVQPEQILCGSIYASSFTTFSKQKQWYRVKVLREVNLKIVEVIYVDYGTVDKIPKTELRFLKPDFCKLPCQAIQCCLTGYNQLEKIALEVSKAFVEIIDNKSIIVKIDKIFILGKDCSIFHVTLFHSNSHNSEKSKNMNDELTIQYLY